jgi:diguanylate cyclase (GGDEF)-like protein
VKRVLAAIGLTAPTAILVVLMADAEAVASTIYGRVPTMLVAGMAVAVGGWLAAMTWLLRQGASTAELTALVKAAEQIAAGDLEVRLPVAGSRTGKRLATALESVSAAITTSQEAATVDRLTGVASRTALLGALINEVERAGRYERPLSVAFVDIDHFKTVNDTYGHAAGDVVLRGVAQTLKGSMRGTDLIGRYGGEEFMLILTETIVDDAVTLAEKLRGLVAKTRFVVEGNRQLAVTVSIGIAGGVGRGLRVDSLARNADAAMYTAKALGRNQTYIFSEPDEDARVLRAPVSPAGRARANGIGLAARDAAVAALGAVIAPLPGHRGQPSALVATIVTALAQRLDLPDQEVDRIRLAALLRDIGKVVVPEEILDKPSQLAAAEWQSVVQHPQLAQVILERAASLREVVPIILHHHEHFSGQGYPFGLRGNEIPLGARIVAIADAYDAMTQDRPYRPGINHDAAVRELRRNAGTQFDPELVALFCALYSEGAPTPDPTIRALLAPLNLVAAEARGPRVDLDPQMASVHGLPERTFSDSGSPRGLPDRGGRGVPDLANRGAG